MKLQTYTNRRSSYNMKKLLLTFAAMLLVATAIAQTTNVHEQSNGYEWPTDPLVVKKLHEWQDTEMLTMSFANKKVTRLFGS